MGTDERKKSTHTESYPTFQISFSAGHEGGKEDLFSFHCFPCCEKHILPWPCNGLHLRLIITEHGQLIQVADSNRAFSINSFVIVIFKITHFFLL